MLSQRWIVNWVVLGVAFAAPAFAEGDRSTTSDRSGNAADQMKHGQNPTQAGTEQSRTSRQGTEAQGRDQMMQPRSDARSASGLSALNGDQVKALQRKLQSQGHYDGKIDGIAGPQTRAALAAFQRQENLNAAAGLDSATRAALGPDFERQDVSGSEATRTSGVDREPMQGTENAELSELDQTQIRHLQSRLQELGYYRGEIDGVAGWQTRSAVMQFFQEQARLAARGEISDTGLEMFGVSQRQPVRGMDANTSTRPGFERSGNRPSQKSSPGASGERGTTYPGSRSGSNAGDWPTESGH